ncbi:hypothetical protein V6N13_071723 [Hibiscus sabdariffa]
MSSSLREAFLQVSSHSNSFDHQTPPPRVQNHQTRPTRKQFHRSSYSCIRPLLVSVIDLGDKKEPSFLIKTRPWYIRALTHIPKRVDIALTLSGFAQKKMQGNVVKNLSEMERDLGRAVIVLSLCNLRMLFQHNHLSELEKLVEWYERFDDARVIVKHYFSGRNSSDEW